MADLKRELGFFTCILLVIGNIIGVGIFTTPGEISIGLPSAGWVLLAWGVGGAMAMTGALTYAELGAMFPKAGGNYVFLKEAYGPMWGFMYGCVYTMLTSAGAISLLSIGFAEYLGLETGTWASKLYSVAVILVLMELNRRGVALGARVMNGITTVKIFAMLGLVVFGFAIGHGSPASFKPVFTGVPIDAIKAIGISLVPMAFAYSGWNSTVLVGEEVRNPQKMIPLSLIVGTLATTAIYVLMNAVYLYAVPLKNMVGEVKIADLAASNLFGPHAMVFTKLLVATSVLGCLSASLLTNPRVTFAMGRDGLFFPFTGHVHPTYHTPSGAILFQSAIACVYVLVGNFGDILRLVSVPLVIIFTMTILSVYVFRWKRPDAPRPYRCWGYPVIPALYALISLWMLYETIHRKPIFGLYGIAIFSLFALFYLLQRRSKARQKTQCPN